MNIAVLFDGGGLSRLGLERAGHTCTGFELNPVAHHLSKMVGSGNSVLADVRSVNLRRFDAAWASPPCQKRSKGKNAGTGSSPYAMDLLDWSLGLRKRFPNLRYLWVENVETWEESRNEWGKLYNAAQFLAEPIQNRNRIIGGHHPEPHVFHPYRKAFPGICPTITATEFKGCATDKRRASRYYGRKLSLSECAYHQGFVMPDGWLKPMEGFTPAKWRNELYRAIGNGVPVYMAEAFGRAVNE